MRGTGVLQGVGERLLDDAIRGDVEGVGEGRRPPLDVNPDVEARGPALGGELSELGEARLGCQRHPVPLLVEDADDGPHLRERLAAAGLDGRQDGSGAPGVALGELLAGAGLDGDGADMVGDDVVQLPGDARALGEGGAL